MKDIKGVRNSNFIVEFNIGIMGSHRFKKRVRIRRSTGQQKKYYRRIQNGKDGNLLQWTLFRKCAGLFQNV